MSKGKRFFVKVYSNNEPFFFDEKQEYVEERYTCEDVRNLHPMEYWQVAKLLNEQQATIQFLQDEIDELKKDIDIYEYEEKKHSEFARKLYDENERLKQKLENIDLNEKNDMVKMIDGKVFIRM